MNDFSELEAELKQLRPVAPSAALIERVEQSLVGVNRATVPAGTAAGGILPQRPKPRMNWFALGLGFAAAGAVFLLARMNLDRVPPQKQPTVAAARSATLPIATTPSRTLVPDGVTRVVYNRSNEGLVFPSDSEAPLRRVRSRSRETLQWKDPSNGASLRVSYPTEEVEFIPVSGQ